MKKEKAFKRYQSFVRKNYIYIIYFQYFTMKSINQKREEKSLLMKDKLREKVERLKDLEKKNYKERKLIMKKLEKMQIKKDELDKIKESKLLKIRTLRNGKFQKNQANKSAIEEFERKRRANILFDEEEKFDRVLSRENKHDSVKLYSRNKTLGDQKYREEKMKFFLKEVNNLKNQSMMKKNDRQKKQIYIAKLRKEEEERKKEEEKRLEALGLA